MKKELFADIVMICHHEKHFTRLFARSSYFEKTDEG